MQELHRQRRFKYTEIVDHISHAIDSGVIPRGGKLPSLRTMSDRYDCSISVAMQAYRELERMGVAYAQERSGYFAAPSRPVRTPSADARGTNTLQEPVQPVSILGRIVNASNDGKLVPLGAGIPDEGLLPLTGLSRSLVRVTRDRPTLLHEYSDEAGSLTLRRQIARHMVARGVSVGPEEILITNGCIEALSLAIQASTDPGDAVAVESPVFLGTIQLLTELRRRIVPVPTSPEDGMDLDSLQDILATDTIGAIIMTAVHQNPLGFVMPEEARRHAVQIAAEHGVPLIEDDIYSETSFDHETERPLRSFDQGDTVIYCSSFSKTLGPGMRIGWLVDGPHQRHTRALKTASTLGVAPLLQEALADFLSTARYAHHMKRLQTQMGHQARALKHMILDTWPDSIAMTNPAGGYYFWVELPDTVDSLTLFEEALARGISIVPGQAFGGQDRFRNFIRLSYGSPVTDRTRAAVEELGRLIAWGDRS
ncbi:MAG: PLP-dependent aminotransferase family protein [Alkalispirochaeta sp.]